MEVGTRPDERGIDPRWTASIPDEAQERIASAFPDMRLVWNESIGKFQALLRCEEVLTVFQDGTLDGWEIVGTFDPPLSVDVILSTLRSRQQFIAWKLRQMGYGTENDSDADVLNAYLDDAPRIAEAVSDQLWQDAVDDYMDGAVARGRDEASLLERSIKRMRGQQETRRAHRPHRLVIPVNPAGVPVYKRPK